MSETGGAESLHRQDGRFVVLVAALGLTVAGLLGWAVLHYGLTQPVATVMTGAGAVIAAVLVYVNGARSRSQDHVLYLEKRRIEEISALHDRYVTVAKFLGDDSAAVRQAGAHALVQLADDWDAHGHPEQRRVCLDLMHNYLRGPAQRAADSLNPACPGEGEVRRILLTSLLERSPSLRDLRHIDISGIRLEEADLIGFDLTQARLVGAMLKYVSVDEAQMEGVDFREATLELVDFTGAYMDSVSFQSAKLYEVSLSKTYLAEANFSEALLADVEFSGANLEDAIFDNAEMPFISLSAEQTAQVASGIGSARGKG